MEFGILKNTHYTQPQYKAHSVTTQRPRILCVSIIPSVLKRRGALSHQVTKK